MRETAESVRRNVAMTACAPTLAPACARATNSLRRARRVARHALLGLICFVLATSTTFAQQAARGNAASGSAKTGWEAGAATMPASITERERFLLDRIEQLERRLAHLEARVSGEPSQQAALRTRANPGAVADPEGAVRGSLGTTSVAPDVTGSAGSASISSPNPSDIPASAKVPFGFGDFTWMNGQSRQRIQPLTTPFGTVSLYLDTYYGYSFNHPRDNTIVGSAVTGRNTEFTINLASIGFETSYKNVIGRISFQTGNMLSLIQDTDGSVARGRNLSTANIKYVREATAGYHLNRWYGVNFEAGIFASYIGLESYLTAENWNYQRSLVCDFTPFYFSGLRAQIHPTEKIKIEPWLMNGFQTYGKWNKNSSTGLSVYYRPKESVGFVANFYYGTDTRNNPNRVRFHHDHSILVRYLNRPDSSSVSKMAFTVNNHYGFESGGGLFPGRSAYMAGTSVAHRIWFHRDKFAWTARGEYITNPSRYLAPLPTASGFLPGADNFSLRISGVTSTFDYLPSDFMAFRMELLHRRSNVPFFAGPGGTTSPDGFQGTPGSFVPDLRKVETRLIFAVNFRM